MDDTTQLVLAHMNDVMKVSTAPFSGSDLLFSMNLMLPLGSFGVHFLILCGVEIIGLLLLFPVF